MSPILMVCLFLSMALATASLIVLQLRRQRRGLQALLQQLLRKEFSHADNNAPHESPSADDDHYHMDRDRLDP
ncbi:hypothetical protein [Novipirellula artificiosorum]|uniref:hypothetical protein n=1 Tax=Novipirellula artificiosorum TaxID=2528016 RepID=UPI0011B741E1|nr:hypothetical protein [Novipirellula artificiosorum]